MVAIGLVVVGHTILAKGVEQVGRFTIGEIGRFGVYLFFVHTSLVLMWSLERRPNTLDFYVRRVFRIYPLAVLAILLAVASHAPVAGGPYKYFHAEPVTFSVLWPNLLFIQDTIRRPVIHGVTWSLGPEVYMYVLLPCLFFYIQRVQRIWPLVLLWALTVLIDRPLFPAGTGNPFPALIPDFLGGVIAYVGFNRRKPILPFWAFPLFLALLFGAFMSIKGARADWYVCLLLGLLLPSFHQMESGRLRRISFVVATYSFGIYLFHPFAIVIGMLLLGKQALWVQLAAMVLPLTGVVYLSYRFIERPMIEAGARVAAWLAHERGVPSPQSLTHLEPAP